MKAARLVVLGVALAAGGLAALLAGRGGEKPAPKPEKPVAQLETTDVLVIGCGIAGGGGRKVTPKSRRERLAPVARIGACARQAPDSAPACARRCGDSRGLATLSLLSCQS